MKLNLINIMLTEISVLGMFLKYIKAELVFL